eukprot:Phypoly_transcript_02410.p1 GENE.Phypoly_transcript_02410~~Phypoly_transcript_02410.p1  ORF type:complete len:778 (-),score=61.79 Phypoly_transcript_02410:297-2630(-)
MDFITSLIAVKVLQICAAQECINACDLNLTTCTWVDYPVYFSSSLNISQNEIQAASIISEVQGLSAIVGQECVDQVKKYTCGYLYPSCANNIVDGAPTKIKPCLQMCEEVNATCYKYIGYLTPDQQKFVNCSQLDPADNSSFFATSDCYVLDNLVPDSCNNGSNPGNSAGCQQYDPALSPLTSSYCAPFISNEIYVSYLSPTAQSSLDILANNTLWEVAKLYPVLTIGCYKGLLSLLCRTAYPTCNRIADSSGNIFELGEYPCNDYCRHVADECSFFSDLIGTALVDCSMTSGDGQLLWPEGPTYPEQVAPNITIQNTCSNELFPPNASAELSLKPVEKCPSLLTKNPHTGDEDQPCWIPCPDPSYTKKMWHDLNIISMVGASISFSLMLFLLLSTILSAKKRARHFHMCVYLTVMLQNISFFINTSHPENHVWCNDPIEYATSATNHACGAQAFIFQWFTLSIAAFWLVIVWHLYVTVVKGRPFDEVKEHEKYFLAAGFGVPLILTIVTTAIGSHGYGPPAGWCYIHNPGNSDSFAFGQKEKSGIDVDYYVFYIPIALCLVVALVLMILVLRHIYKSFREIRDIRTPSRADLAVQGRILFFVIVLFVVFVLVAEWRVNLQALNPDKIKHDDFLFVFCQIKNDLGIEYSNVCVGDLPYRINYAHTSFETFLASSFGIFIFITFGTDITYFKWWQELAKLKSKKDVLEYLATETTHHSSGNSNQLLFFILAKVSFYGNFLFYLGQLKTRNLQQQKKRKRKRKKELKKKPKKLPKANIQ